MRDIQHKIRAGIKDKDEADPLEMFVSSTNIRYCYYHETHKILGNTYGMCIMQVSNSVSIYFNLITFDTFCILIILYITNIL